MNQNITNALEVFYGLLSRENLVPSTAHFDRHCRAMFRGIEPSGKRVLDVGGGFGLYSFYLWCQGAKSVTCLEPEGMGSSSGVKKVFNMLKTSLNCEAVHLQGRTLQDFDEKESYELVLLHNSINHLDEPACVDLLRSKSSRTAYLGLAEKLFGLCAKKGVLLIADCSRHNFFNMLGIRNPFVPSIEWSKHHQPSVWQTLLAEVGFSEQEVRWFASDSIGGVGKLLLTNSVGAFLTTSRFVIRAVKAGH